MKANPILTAQLGWGPRSRKKSHLKVKLSSSQTGTGSWGTQGTVQKKKNSPRVTAKGLSIRVNSSDFCPGLVVPTLWWLKSSGSDCRDILGGGVRFGDSYQKTLDTGLPWPPEKTSD